MLPAAGSASLGFGLPQLRDDPSLRDEQLSRIRQFFGDKNQKKLEKSYVVVVGLGGVGSHAAHMLARSGVAKLRLIDFDNVTLSSLNRHAVATRRDVGIPKVEACRSHFAEIAPFVEVDAVTQMFRGEDADALLIGPTQPDAAPAAAAAAVPASGAAAGGGGGGGGGGSPAGSPSEWGRPDFVLDCIDDTPTKAQLVLACQRLGLRVVCALGAGGKCDPTRMHISTLDSTVIDALAMQLRYRLRLDMRKQEYFDSLPEDERKQVQERLAQGLPPLSTATGAQAAGGGQEKQKAAEKIGAKAGDEGDHSEFWLPLQDELSEEGAAAYDKMLAGTRVVYTSEVPAVKLLPLTQAQAENPSEFGAVGGMRLRVMPVLGTLPALMGMAVATHAMCELAGKPIAAPLSMPRAPKSSINKLFHRLTHREKTVYGLEKPEHEDDVSYAVVEYLLGTVWQGRCAVSGLRLGNKRGGGGGALTLTRWRPDSGPSRHNWVLLSDECAQELLDKGADAAFDAGARASIEARFRWMKDMESFGGGVVIGDGRVEEGDHGAVLADAKSQCSGTAGWGSLLETRTAGAVALGAGLAAMALGLSVVALKWLRKPIPK